MLKIDFYFSILLTSKFILENVYELKLILVLICLFSQSNLITLN